VHGLDSSFLWEDTVLRALAPARGLTLVLPTPTAGILVTNRTGRLMTDRTIAVLFVCLGNICRSPLAESLFRAVVAEAGLEGRFRIDSAGTSGYHDGDPPDPRTAGVAARRGVAVEGSSRRITGADVESFEYLIAMDSANLAELERLARAGAGSPRVHLLREFDPETNGELDVPDPYFGGPDGFEDVHDLVERAVRGLLDHLREAHDL
jgi:protein-tyrosine phosphatase